MVNSGKNAYKLSQRGLSVRAVEDPQFENGPSSSTTEKPATTAAHTTTPVQTTPKTTAAVATTTLSTLGPATTPKPTTSAAKPSSSTAVFSATAIDPFSTSSVITSSSSFLTTASVSSALPSATQSTTPSSDSSSNTGLIAGIAGGVGAIVVLGAFVMFMIRRNRRRNSTRASRTMDQLFSPTANAENSQRYNTSAPVQPTTGYENDLASPNMAYLPANNLATAGQYYGNDYNGYADNQQMYQHMDDSYSHNVVSPTMAQNNQLYRANTTMTTGNNGHIQQDQGMYYDAYPQQHQMYHDSQYQDQYYQQQEQAYHDPQQQQAYHDPQQQAYHDPSQQAYHDPQQQAYHDPQQQHPQAYYDSNQQAYHDPQQAYTQQQADYYSPEHQHSTVNTHKR